MKSITVMVPDSLYRAVRNKASEASTSVSDVIRTFLEGFGKRESDFNRRKRIEQEILGEITTFSASDRLKRSDIHSRHAVS